MPAPSITVDQYYIDGNFDLFVGTLANGLSTPTVITVSSSGVTALGATAMTVAATSDQLYEGQRIRFGSQDVYLTADAASGATSLSIRALVAEVADATDGITYAMKPVYAIEEVSFTKTDQTLEVNTSDSPSFGTEELKLYQTVTRNCMCFDILNSGNLGLETLKVAGAATGKAANIYYELIESDNSGEFGLALIKDFKRETLSKDKEKKYSFTLRCQGSPTKLVKPA